jgi:predicted PurR-regulated permease PerM
MFNTSVDVMYGALSLAIIVFTGFLVWMMYYAVQILKQGNEVIADIRSKIAEFESAIASIKEKVVSSATSISFIASQIGSVVDVIQKRSTRKKSK